MIAQATLRSLVDYYTGGGWGKESPERGFEVPAWVIRGTDIPRIRDGGRGACPLRYHAASNARSRRLGDGDIVFEVSGGSRDQPVGRALLMSHRRLELWPEGVIPASFCKLVRPNRERVDPTYLYFFLQWLYDSRFITEYQVQSTGISNFQFEEFLDRQAVPVPPLPTQRKIAAVLSAYDDLIQNNNRRIKILEEIAQRIYREWFVDLRYPGHEDVPLVDSELGPIPEGWQVASLDRMAEVTRGLSWDRSRETNGHGTPVVTIPNVQERLILKGMTHLSKITSEEGIRYGLRQGDVVLVGSNGNPDRVGHAVRVADGPPLLFASFLVRVRPIPERSALLYVQLRDRRLADQWRAGAIGATSLRNLRLSSLRASRIFVPAESVGSAAEEIFRPLLDAQDVLAARIEAARRARELLLPRLISGEINLDTLDIAAPEEKVM